MSTTQSSRTTYGESDLGRTPRKTGRDTRVNYYDAGAKEKDYELPKIVQSAREGWMEVAKALAIVCALLAGVEAQFVQILGNPPSSSPVSLSYRAVRALNYLSLLLNISAVVGTFFMLDILTELPFRVYKYGNNQEGERPTKQSISAMLLEFGADGRWTVAKGFTQACAILGMLTAVVQIIVWVWMNESREVSIVVTFVGMLGVFLAAYWFIASLGRSRRILNES